jgi:hypothetical protein
VIVPIVAAAVLTLFAWPNARLEPRDLPIGVAGPPPAAQVIEQRLGAREGAFDVHRYADEAAAREAIEDREVYGALVATPAGRKVLTATGASAAVAMLLEEAARAAPSRPGGAPVQVEDVVVATRGNALASSVLPMVLAGLLTGALVAILVPAGAARQALLLVAASALAGLVSAAIVQSWLDVIGGDWLVNAGVFGLTVLAIGSVVAGLHSLVGVAGIGVAALLMVLVGNPFAAVGTAPELLPEPAGGIGQLLPPGAGGNLLRSTGYFDGAGAGGHLAVLLAWVLVGLAMLAAAELRGRRGTAPATAAG